ncbi:Replicase polyprotein 1ab [Trichinella spiralis]|uniref:Replicase polyprotein 1ab n=1 Tax=Trichinella spiralis TaxID=6334 RepID=A0ABR3KBN2_TRISP
MITVNSFGLRCTRGRFSRLASSLSVLSSGRSAGQSDLFRLALGCGARNCARSAVYRHVFHAFYRHESRIYASV